MSRKSTASTEPTTTAIAPAETAIVPVDSGIMAIVDDHTSKKLITDQEAMERLGQAVDIAVQRAEDAIPAAGINLARGTRDWVYGIKLSDYDYNGNKTWYEDGFKTTHSAYIKKTTDEEGFTVLTIERSGLTSDGWTRIDSSPIMYEGEVTVSFDVRINSNIPFDTAQQNVFGNASTYSLATITGVPISEIVRDRWYPVNIKLTIGAVKHLIFELQRNGSISFRKLCVYKGNIANPTWSASPFDTDITIRQAKEEIPSTGINLLRGTRDFSRGVDKYKTTSYCTDGFSAINSLFDFYQDDDGFTVAHVEQYGTSSTATKMIAASVIQGLNPGDRITICLDLKIDDLSQMQSQSMARIDTIRSNSTVGDGLSFSVNDGIQGDVKNNEWYHWIVTTELPSDFTNGNALLFDARINRDGSIHFKKLAVFKGDIANPIWSESPFDVSEVKNAMTLDRIQTVTVTDEIALSDEQFKNPGRWGISSGSLSKIRDLPELPNNTYINLITMRVWSDNTTMQIVIQPATGCFCMRAIDTTWITINPWVCHYAS